MLHTNVIEKNGFRLLDTTELEAVSGGMEVEAGSGDTTISCCSVSLFGVTLEVDVGSLTFTLEDAAEFIQSEGERQQELGTSQAGR